MRIFVPDLIYIPFIAGQGFRIDLAHATEDGAWRNLADAGEERDTPKRRRQAAAYGWRIIPCKLEPLESLS